MAKIAIATAVALAAALALPPAPASADDTGVGQMLHTMKRYGKKVCFEGHFHTGSGTGATKKAAEVDAVKAWAGFTAWEYGTDWAQWSKAHAKTLTCSQNSSGFSCQADAMPCK